MQLKIPSYNDAKIWLISLKNKLGWLWLIPALIIFVIIAWANGFIGNYGAEAQVHLTSSASTISITTTSQQGSYVGVIVTNATGGYMWGAHTIIFYNNGSHVAKNFSIKMRVANWNNSNGGIARSGVLEIDTLNNFTEIRTSNVTEPDGYWLEMTVNSLAPKQYAAFEIYLNSTPYNDNINVAPLIGAESCMSPVNQLPYFNGPKSCMDFSNLGSCNIPNWVKMPLILTVNKTQQVFLTPIGNLSSGETVGGCPV